MLFLDTSALLKRYVEEEGTTVVLDRMAVDVEWAASALCLTEAEVSLCHLGFDEATTVTLRHAIRSDFDRFLVVPVDEACLARAAAIGCEERVRSLDAIHLAAADRLPRPLTFLSFDHRQHAAAARLGLEVVSV